LKRFFLNHKRSTEMHPEQIKAEIRMRGTTPAAIADSLHLSRMTVSNVIHSRSKSRRVAAAISKLIKRPMEQIWPGRYGPASKNGLRRGSK
jgi:lambda repressor-like predicted transcriptional regulator